MRINKYIATQGLATRRGADALIAAGKVHINGRIAVLGDKVNPTDKVEVNTKAVKESRQQLLYYVYNKPVGIVTHSAQKGEKDILDSIEQTNLAKEEVVSSRSIPAKPTRSGILSCSPIGRLDKDSHGLILLTNDGRVTDRLLSPEHDHEKEYEIKVTKPLKQSMLTWLARGVKLEDGYITKPAEVWAESDYIFHIVITEGKRHQIRRMVTAVGNEVADLKRVRIMNMEIGDLQAGANRQIQGKELLEFLASIGL